MRGAVDRELQKWALLIGIKEYPKWGAGHQMEGPINDIDAIETLLTSRQFGFPPQNALTLTSPADKRRKRELANRENILKAFRTHLIENEQIKQGDIVVIYYSGHGSWIPDKNQDEEVDVVDGLLLARDETLVPCDSGSDHARDITDDEIADLLERLAKRTRNVNLFFDSCNSGTITRVWPEEEAAEGHIRWVPPPPCDYPVSARLEGKGPGGWLPLSDNYMVISACHASERAREKRFVLGGFRCHGVMTYCLLKVLRDVGSDTTYYDIWEDLKVEVNRINPDQNPQIEGAFERKVFGGATLPRERYVEVTEKSSGAVTLAVGLVHGATVGSRFAIYRKGMQTFEDKTARTAVVRLTEVDAFTSIGAVEEGSISKVQAGSPAIEIEHDYGSMQMAVRVSGDDHILDTVRQQIRTSPLLLLAETAEQPSAATVYLRHPRGSDDKDTGQGKVLCIAGSSGGDLVEPIAPDAKGPQRVRDRLDDIAKCYNLLAIHNADTQSNLARKVGLRLLRRIGQDGNGNDLIEPVERDAGGNIVLKAGDRVYIEAVNQSDQSLHIAIFYCSSDWRIEPIFPPLGAHDDRIAAHSSRRTIRFRVEWPDEHPKPLLESQPLPRDTIKMFATTQQVDFHAFWRSRTRAMEEKTSLPRLIGLAAGGGPIQVTRSLEEKEEDWTTDQLVFYTTK